jgi:tetratricopeptide (TPR) repeat protein
MSEQVVYSVTSMTSARSVTSISAGLILLCLIAYMRLWGNDFIDLDDEDYITTNVHVRDGLTADDIAWAWTTHHTGFWFPLVWMSFQIDGTLSHNFGSHTGLMPSVYHGQNLFWHTATTVLLFLTLMRMTACLWPSTLVAALFAVHPLHVESVAWATERKDVLSAFFWMLTVFAYVRYTEKTTVRRYVLVLFSFVLGLMTKPMLVTLPCALLLLDYWPLRRYGWKDTGADENAESVKVRPGLRRIFLEKLPLFILAVAGSVLAIRTQAQANAVSSLEEISIPSRLANAAISYAWYLDKTIWPSNLAPFYSHSMNEWTWTPVLVSVALLAAISLCAFAMARRAPWFLVGWLWFLGTLVPVIGLVQVGAQSRADRFAYIPHIGLFIAIVWSSAALMDRERAGFRTRVLLGSGLVLGLTLVTTIQVGYWKDSLTIWSHALEANPENDRAHCLLGRVWIEKFYAKGNAEYLDKAIDHYRAGIRINPKDPELWCNLGSALYFRGDLEEAAAHLRSVLVTKPDYLDAQYYLGLVEYSRKNYPEALRAFHFVVEHSPQATNARAFLGHVLWDVGQRNEARAQWESALAINGEIPEAIEGMGQIFLLQGNNAEAARSFQTAIQLKLNHPRTWSQLGIAAGRLGMWEWAIAAHDRAVKLAAFVMKSGSDRSVYVRRLAFAIHSADRIAEAQSQYREGTKLDPDWPTANLRMAWKLATSKELKPGDAATAFELACEVRQATATPSSRVLDVLAATLASTDRFDEAVIICRRALMQAASLEAGPIAARLDLYEKKKRYVGE